MSNQEYDLIGPDDVRLELSIVAGIQDNPTVHVEGIAESLDARPDDVRDAISELDGEWELLKEIEVSGMGDGQDDQAGDDAPQFDVTESSVVVNGEEIDVEGFEFEFEFDDGLSADEIVDELSEEADDGCAWLRDDPHTIVREAYDSRGAGSRALREVLDAAEQMDNCVTLNQRLALGGISFTRGLLAELGLTKPSGQLLDSDERRDRIDAMREGYL
ncbi:hypothetical protein [Halalkalicoccus jeotgali]|uniref:Uncharacterized protein n=1 Tax=Halalkalicoccus jeotgali (strain DSM 18796 / CECT 7217 / JCM 14584 / KCTC 4019 / B3) TaxID=795797 RepID=D8J9L2_HALJB|nr:hypothetical protein [Halalkalicoccus jeotgali]ADJ14424.1 hypothetical protein HacjB3_05165 [Halalkalicoccus jeotgali B3]ELY40140.1 hypothetical protein C497_03550 [Halalkalicoccus jeotgali B3]